MLENYKDLVVNQFQAALRTLDYCVDRCPDTAWNAPVAKYPFSQVVFHTLIFTDLYLGNDVESLRQQTFHRERVDFFGDYEQLEDREPVSLYEKSAIKSYVDHCRTKVSQVVAAESVATLAAPAGFAWLQFSRAELYIYNIRHIQHHAAQLSLRLRLDGDEPVPWVASGWGS